MLACIKQENEAFVSHLKREHISKSSHLAQSLIMPTADVHTTKVNSFICPFEGWSYRYGFIVCYFHNFCPTTVHITTTPFSPLTATWSANHARKPSVLLPTESCQHGINCSRRFLCPFLPPRPPCRSGVSTAVVPSPRAVSLPEMPALALRMQLTNRLLYKRTTPILPPHTASLPPQKRMKVCSAVAVPSRWRAARPPALVATNLSNKKSSNGLRGVLLGMLLRRGGRLAHRRLCITACRSSFKKRRSAASPAPPAPASPPNARSSTSTLSLPLRRLETLRMQRKQLH